MRTISGRYTAPDDRALAAIVRARIETTGTRPTAKEIGRALDLTEVQLRRVLHVAGGQRVREAITAACLDRSAQLIREGLKIEAAFRLAGFRHDSNFSRQFKRRFGCTPSAFRRSE